MLRTARVMAARALVRAARALLPATGDPPEDLEDDEVLPAPFISDAGLAMLAVPATVPTAVIGEEPLAGSVAARMRRSA